MLSIIVSLIVAGGRIALGCQCVHSDGSKDQEPPQRGCRGGDFALAFERVRFDRKASAYASLNFAGIV